MTNSQALDWARQVGGAQFDRGNAVAVDHDGNVFTVGLFFGTVDFDPGPGVFGLTSGSSGDLFVLKLDSQGDFVWAVHVEGNSSVNTNGLDIAVDENGVAVTGSFGGTTDFDPGLGVFNLTSNGLADIFVLKLSSNGAFEWAVRLGGDSTDQGRTVAFDSAGNVVSAGWFLGTADFDPGPGIFNLTADGHTDAYALKLNGLGNFVWAVRVGNSLQGRATAVALDGNDNIVVTGDFAGTVDFDPGAGVLYLTSVGDFDIFTMKLEAGGDLIWATSTGGIFADRVWGLATDSAGSSLLTGWFRDTVDFDPGPGTFLLTATGGVDIYVQKVDDAGQFVWAVGMGGTNPFDNNVGYDIAVDAFDNVITTGVFEGQTDFDPGPATTLLSVPSHQDVFVQMLDRQANLVWAVQLGGANFEEYGYGVATTSTGKIALTGQFFATGDFDPGTEAFNLTSNGSRDVFVEQLTPAANLAITKSDGVTTAVPGQYVVYTILAENSGPVADPSVSVVDSFPSVLDCSYFSTSTGGASGNTMVGVGHISDILSMPPASSVIYIAVCEIDPAANGVLSNTVTIMGSLPDLDLGDNTATDMDTTLLPTADLSITKSNGVAAVLAGKSVAYTIVASNTGPSADPFVSIVDFFPSVLDCSYSSTSSGGASGNTALGVGDITDTLSMPPASSITYTAVCAIDSAANGVLSNTAVLSGSVSDPNPGNNSATDIDSVQTIIDVPALSWWGLLAFAFLLGAAALRRLCP